VQTNDGVLKYYNKEGYINSLIADIPGNNISANNTLITSAKTETNTRKATNSTIDKFFRNHFKLNILFRPIMAHALAGLR
jgi:hypothetical protein